MKYSVLMTGKNRLIKEDLFTHFWAEFECLTCSASYEDIKNHLKYFTPDALICCLLEEETGSIQQIVSMREKLKDKHISLVIVGAKEDCNAFLQQSPDLPDLVIEKPFAANQVSDTVAKFLNKKRREKTHAQIQVSDATLDLLREIDQLQKRKHILVIDDDPLMLKLIKEHLHEEYDVATAISGKIAMKFLANRTTDLIFLDYEMPDEDGPEILEQLHKNEATKHIPVVFLTSIVDREKIEKALLLKPQGYLLKPIDREKLMEAIEKQLG